MEIRTFMHLEYFRLNPSMKTHGLRLQCVISTTCETYIPTPVFPCRFIFWTEISKYPKIERATLTGNNREAIVSSGLLFPICIDVDVTGSNRRIYWADTSRDTVESANLTGGERRIIKRMSHTEFYDIALFRACIVHFFIWQGGTTFNNNNIIINNWATVRQNKQNDYASSEDSDKPGHPSSLIRVFAVHMKKVWVLSYPLSAQHGFSGCPGWSESSLGAQAILLILSCAGSLLYNNSNFISRGWHIWDECQSNIWSSISK